MDGPPRHGAYLHELVAEADAAAARLAAADPAARRVQEAAARRASARLSVRLDASPLTDETAAEVDARETRRASPGDPLPDRAAPTPPPAGRGSWAHTLKLDAMPTAEIAAVEYANLLACFDAEPAVATSFLDDPLAGLAALHEVICRGLVAPRVTGRTRRTAQAVHDGAHGRVLYHAPPPEALDALLGDLGSWLAGPAAAEPAVVVAGVLHERILEWQPFEAANGRLARAAARVVLRARGLDPQGLGVSDRLHAADPLGYYAEVAATIRRRDLERWLERAAEAVVDGLGAALAGVAPGRAPSPPPRALAAVADLEAGAAITLTEYAARAGADRMAARADLRALVRARVLEHEPGARGLRFRSVRAG